MKVGVVYAAPGVEALAEVEVAQGATVEDAVRLSGLRERHGLDPARVSYAVFGRRATPATVLAAGDRVEILRPLVADPKTVRRRRAAANPLPRPPARVKTPRGPA